MVEKEPTQDGVWNKASRKGEQIWYRVEGAQRECGSSKYGWSTCVSVGWDEFLLSRRPPPKKGDRTWRLEGVGELRNW